MHFRQGKAETMTGDDGQREEPAMSEPDSTPTEPTITAAYATRWTDASGPNPGERSKSVIRKSFVEPCRADSTGFSITLTESVLPGDSARYQVRWRDNHHDETETLVNQADALAAYERLIRDYQPRADCLDERSPI